MGIERIIISVLYTGMTVDEIAAIRTTFRSQVNEAETFISRNTDEDLISFRGRLEDAWMARQGPFSEFSSNLPQIRGHTAGGYCASYILTLRLLFQILIIFLKIGFILRQLTSQLHMINMMLH